MKNIAEQKLTLSRGQLVALGVIAPSKFYLSVLEKSGANRRFSGTTEELIALVTKNFANARPGIGNQDGDVLLIELPPEGFFTNIVPLTEENSTSVKLKWEPRVIGEAPVGKLVIYSDELIPASFVKAVVYRADVLAKDSGRSSDAEWEIVAVLADPVPAVPMDTNTMVRNFLHRNGGTYREYTPEQWAEAADFWNSHAYLEAIPKHD